MLQPLRGLSTGRRAVVSVSQMLQPLRGLSTGHRALSATQRWSSSSSKEASLLLGLRAVEKKAVWLSSFMIHNANNLRAKRDGLKVGGHQASSSSMSTILTALYFAVLREKDRVSVKPHASPMYHALQYIMGNQTQDQLERFRSYGGVQSYPSRTKDSVDVDFSTGSVGLGATITSFMSLTQDWLLHKGIIPKKVTKDAPAKMVALIGDAELDEGNIYEGLVETWKAKTENNIFIVDYNRQSLDKISDEGSWKQVDRMFRINGWEVINVKYGKTLLAAFQPSEGGKGLKRFFNAVPNDVYSSLVFRGGAAFRKEMLSFLDGFDSNRTAPAGYPAQCYEPVDANDMATTLAWLGLVSDQVLLETMSNLGGHCFESLLEAFSKAMTSPQRTVFICYTVKGNMLPIAGHRDNHGLFLNAQQMATLQQKLGVPAGQEWSSTAGLSSEEERALKQLVAACPFRKGPGKFRDFSAECEVYDIPSSFLEAPAAGKKSVPVSTQTAFGQMLLNIAKSKHAFADRIMTLAPDVATSTNLSGFVGVRGVFGQKDVIDSSKKLQVVSAVRWDVSPKGQHVELGIAENNLFLALGAAGLSHSLFAQRVLPIGTLYDPFISRGLDALNYGCYQDSRFLLVATPSGITLSPEGGAHQSINTPLIGMSQPGLTYYEPATADELDVILSWALKHMQAPQGQGGSVYLRLSTRPLEQPTREMTADLREAVENGAYWHSPPSHAGSEAPNVCLVFCGCVLPEAVEAHRLLVESHGLKVALLQVTSPDRLFKSNQGGKDAVRELLKDLPTSVPIVTVHDGHPAALSWLGGVRGHAVRSLGVSAFGQSGDLVDLYKHFGIDAANIAKTALDVVSSVGAPVKTKASKAKASKAKSSKAKSSKSSKASKE